MNHICCKFIAVKKILSKPFLFTILKLNCKSWSIVFFGSDSYSLISLKALHKQMEQLRISNLEIVVTNEKTLIYNYAVSQNFKIHIWPPVLKELYDFGVIVSFGKFIPKEIINKFHYGIFNVHASLLPKYRGGMPVVHALKNGDTETGVTVTKITHERFDAGEIILQKLCDIDKNELMPSLYRKLAIIGCESLLEVITTMPECLKNSFPQLDKGASYAPKIKKETAVVKWTDMTALEVFNLHRALFGIIELRTTWKDQVVKLVCLSLSDSHSCSLVVTELEKLDPGSFIYDKKSRFLYVQCKDKSITLCTILFKAKMYTANNFYTGYLYNLPKTMWKFGS